MTARLWPNLVHLDRCTFKFENTSVLVIKKVKRIIKKYKYVTLLNENNIRNTFR